MSATCGPIILPSPAPDVFTGAELHVHPRASDREGLLLRIAPCGAYPDGAECWAPLSAYSKLAEIVAVGGVLSTSGPDFAVTAPISYGNALVRHWTVLTPSGIDGSFTRRAANDDLVEFVHAFADGF